MMVVRTTGVGWLTLMMRAERLAGGGVEPDTEWLLHGPTDPAVVQTADDEPPSITLLAAE
ncbi:hypothetical protein CSW58_02935 [Caulobacter sp. B11]|nr:hypothetical protein CSW58_02935 [Caulobacter sp. B11]